jgi:hypothetical protein
MSDADKHETISSSLAALPSLGSVKLKKLMKTWLEVLLGFPGSQITDMFRVYCEEVLNNRWVVEKIDIGSIIDVFSSLQEWEKEKLSDCLKEVIFSFPDKTDVLSVIPMPILKSLKMG